MDPQANIPTDDAVPTGKGPATNVHPQAPYYVDDIRVVDQFNLIPTCGTFDGGKWVKFNRNHGSTFEPCEITVPPQQDTIDLKRSYFELQVQVMSDGDPLVVVADDNRSGVTNLFPHGIWKNISCELNMSTETTDLDNMYAWKAYLYYLLNFSDNQKLKNLFYEGWIEDTPGAFDSTLLVGAGHNAGFLARQTMFRAGAVKTFYFRPVIDWQTADRLLPSGMSMTWKFDKNARNFYMMDNEDAGTADIRIKNLCYHTYQLRLNDNIRLNIEKEMFTNKYQQLWNYKAIKGVKRYMPPDRQSFEFTDVFHDIIPDRVFMVFITQDSYNGTRAANPYKFIIPNNLIEFTFNVNGRPYPNETIKAGVNNFYNLYKTCVLEPLSAGMGRHAPPTPITMDEFLGGYGVFTQDFTPALSGSKEYKVDRQRGQLGINIHLSQNLAQATYLLIWSEVDEVMKLDYMRNVSESNMARNLV